MSEIERATDRPQDVGRDHRRKVTPAPATLELLDRYHAAMRLELEDILAELWPSSGQLALMGDVDRPSFGRRTDLWALAVKLGRELASAPASSEPRSTPEPRRDQPAPALSVTARRALGQSGR